MRAVAIIPRISIALCLAPLLAGAFVSRADAADVRVDAIVVKPASPGPSALCELKVRLKNAGSRSVSYFRFNVKIDGQDVPTYKVYTYAVNIEPGTADELALNNFYSPPEAKAFEVQVTLVEAQWVEVKKEGTTTTTTPSGAVAGLPTGASLSVKVSPSKS
ncbi:MAG: hypothetical protein ABSE56_09965 [Bryobacteraceae bacterium]|jgi:hypothetical protein